jgi:tripartite-type tricarboxylate transporter receptor subunit TctC
MLVAVAALLGNPLAAAQPYPSKPIHIIVPYPAGGTSDILARALGPGITAALGQPVIVENKPGSTGNVGAVAVAVDGYTPLADIGRSRSARAFSHASIRSGRFRACRHGRVFAFTCWVVNPAAPAGT